jgi:tetratricopeptide (TPR) repeat protein
MTNSEEDTDSTARLGATPVAPRLARAPKQKRSVPPAQPQSRQEEENEAATIFMAAAALDNAGNDLCDKGEYEGAMTSYTRALQLKQQSLRNVDSDGLLASVATSINNIGYLRQRSGASPEESMLAYRDSLKIKKEILGETHLSVGKTLNNIGSVYYSAHEFEHALQAYHEAKDIMERNLGTTHGDVATVHSNIGDVYMAMGDGQRAHDQYKEALDIRWTCFHGHDPKVIRLLEKIAALEMDQWSVCGHDQGEDDETRDFEDEEEMPDTLHNLSCEVQEDIKEISDLERKMALDMVKDKLRILKGMRNLDIENDAEEVASPRSCTTPLSKSERCEALSSVKERLAKLRERRAMRESTNHETDKEHKYGSLTVCLREFLEK